MVCGRPEAIVSSFAAAYTGVRNIGYILRIPSFPRNRESMGSTPLDSRFRGNDAVSL